MYKEIEDFYELMVEADGLAELKYIDLEKITEKTAEKLATLRKVIKGEKVSKQEYNLLFSLIPKRADYD